MIVVFVSAPLEFRVVFVAGVREQFFQIFAFFEVAVLALDLYVFWVVAHGHAEQSRGRLSTRVLVREHVPLAPTTLLVKRPSD